MSEDNERDVYVITKRINGESVPERHFVQLPNYNEKGWYVNGLSIDAFKRRMQKRYIKTWQDEKGSWAAQAQRVSFSYRVESKRDFDDNQSILTECGVPERPVLEFHHASLKAFYEHIGYDPKKNKLTVESVLL